MKLELKYLKNYLGTGLKCTVNSNMYPDPILTGLNGIFAYFNYHGSYLSFEMLKIKPLLLPLSALDTQLLINYLHGKMSDTIFNWIDYFNSDSQNKDMAILCAPYPVIEWCFENHIDVFSLIPAGLAIDKRTIK